MAGGREGRVTIGGRLCPFPCVKSGDSGNDGEVMVGTEGKESNKGERIDELLDSSDMPSDTGDVVLPDDFPAKKTESMCKDCIASSG